MMRGRRRCGGLERPATRRHSVRSLLQSLDVPHDLVVLAVPSQIALWIRCQTPAKIHL
jgi:hypothetical protein